MLLGYARVSTIDQNLALQRDALAEAGCQKIFTEQMSGAVTDRPALHEALAFARSGDTLIVWKLDRLARSMKQLIETIEELRLRGVGFHLVAWIRQESSKIRYLWRLTDSEVSSSFSGLAYPCNKVTGC
jgi:DNA invertase Pin-like site-specific DNA recombinase